MEDSSTPVEDHDGEQSESAAAATTSMCTEVCGGGLMVNPALKYVL